MVKGSIKRFAALTVFTCRKVWFRTKSGKKHLKGKRDKFSVYDVNILFGFS
jgi:hypothetical protein